jgi:hypothetical protein
MYRAGIYRIYRRHRSVCARDLSAEHGSSGNPPISEQACPGSIEQTRAAGDAWIANLGFGLFSALPWTNNIIIVAAVSSPDTSYRLTLLLPSR